MLKAAELKRGSIVEIEGAPHAVENLQVQTPSARGSASLYKVRFRNLVSKQKLDRTFKGDDPLKDTDLDRQEIQFLFKQHDAFTFMNLTDFSQFTLHADDVAEQSPFLSDGLEGIVALISNGRVLTIEPPPVVELPIAQCDPPLRGASATARTKPATLSTGHIVQVPEYMAQGEVVRVDTRTGKFLSRA